MTTLQRLSIVLLSQISLCARQRIPQTLHLIQSVIRLHSFTRKSLAHFRCIINFACSQHVLRAFAVQITISSIQTLSIIHEFRCLLCVARLLVDFCLQRVEIDQCWRVINGFLHVLQSKLVLLKPQEMLSKEVVDPNESRWQFLMRRPVQWSFLITQLFALSCKLSQKLLNKCNLKLDKRLYERLYEKIH